MDLLLLDLLDAQKLLLAVNVSAADEQVWKIELGVFHHLVIIEGSYLSEGRIQEYFDVSLDLLNNQVWPKHSHYTKPYQVSCESLLKIELCPIHLRLGYLELVVFCKSIDDFATDKLILINMVLSFEEHIFFLVALLWKIGAAGPLLFVAAGTTVAVFA